MSAAPARTSSMGSTSPIIYAETVEVTVVVAVVIVVVVVVVVVVVAAVAVAVAVAFIPHAAKCPIRLAS